MCANMQEKGADKETDTIDTQCTSRERITSSLSVLRGC